MSLPNPFDFGQKLFRASDAAGWINGHTINVDTGYNVT
jgi:hypothetical protein